MHLSVSVSGIVQRTEPSAAGALPTFAHVLPPSVDTSASTEASPSPVAVQVTWCWLPADQDSPPVGEVSVSASGSGAAGEAISSKDNNDSRVMTGSLSRRAVPGRVT